MRAIVAYVPALHRGYIDFLNKYSCKVFLLDLSLVREIPRMDRDIRALEAKEICNALKGMGFSDIDVINDINQVVEFDELIMPDEDVSRDIAERYLKNRKVEFIPVFLRWERHNSQKKNTVIPDEIITEDEFDKRIMKEALFQAEKSPDWWRQIGSLIVKDEKIILTGFNKPLPSQQVHNIFGDPRSNFDYGIGFEISKFIHAEAGMIAEAAGRGISLKGSSLYVTTFPCPACAKLVAMTGITKVYYKEGYSLLDAKDILESFGIETIRVDD